jgi:hypothetical protein
MLCEVCSVSIEDKRKGAKYCSTICKRQGSVAKRALAKGQAPPVHRGPNTGRTSAKREYRLNRIYGITVEQYDSLLEKQNQCCAVCRKPAEGFKTNLAVDHNHITGEIRGLLCTHCNHRLVGRWRDGELLRRIADYVDQGTGWFVPEQFKAGRRRKRKVSITNGKL